MCECDARKCDLDLLSEWFRLLFRKIKLLVLVVGMTVPLWTRSHGAILLKPWKILPGGNFGGQYCLKP